MSIAQAALILSFTVIALLTFGYITPPRDNLGDPTGAARVQQLRGFP